MIAIVEDENFVALRNFAGDANCETVRVGGGQRELPEWEAEATLEIVADPESVFGGKHERDAVARLARDGFDNGVGRMAGHGAGVAEAEVDVLAIVYIGEVSALGALDKDRKRAGPLFHPVHGDAAEERVLGAAVEGGGFRMIVDEALRFTLVKTGEFVGVDGGHGVVARVRVEVTVVRTGIRGRGLCAARFRRAWASA